MGFGLSNALEEITLVLFTTLSPSGVVACLVAALPLLSFSIDGDARHSAAKSFSIPLVVASAGLIMSATHLGNPANALYVAAGIGRSPLSNEVAAAVVFLVCAGAFWLASFSSKPHVLLMRVWYVLLALTGVCFIYFIGEAYHVETILTWRLPTVPVSIWANALLGGPILGLVTLRVARCQVFDQRIARILTMVSCVALIVCVIAYVIQGSLALGLSNSLVSVSQLMPHYWVAVAAFAIMAVSGVALAARMGDVSSRIALVAPTCLTLGAIFIMRFGFYMMHLTVGLAV